MNLAHRLTGTERAFHYHSNVPITKDAAPVASPREVRNGMSLKAKTVRRSVLAPVIAGLLLFVPAGTLKFWQGWVFLAVVVVPIIYSLVYLYRHDPKLLERRLQAKETSWQQKLFQILWAVIFCPAFVFTGLDFRFGWTRMLTGSVPLWALVIGQAAVLGGTLLVIWVMKVNTYASRTIEVSPGQTVISSGPYSAVRHPMYSGIVMQMLGTPIALGSYLALPAFVLLVPVIVFRLIHEERTLRQELIGYSEYCVRVRYRLLPFVW